MVKRITKKPMSQLRRSPSFESLLVTRSGARTLTRSGFPQEEQTRHLAFHSQNEGRPLKRVHSDSDIVSSSTKTDWTCHLCSYENVDPSKVRCTLCGSLRYSILSSPLAASSGGIISSRKISQGVKSRTRSKPTASTFTKDTEFLPPITNLDERSGLALPRTPRCQRSSSATLQQNGKTDAHKKSDIFVTFKKTAGLISTQLLHLAMSLDGRRKSLVQRRKRGPIDQDLYHHIKATAYC